MSFYTSLTGINAATVELAVTSNNIANSGTSGFKKSSAEFGDIFATSPLQKSSSVVGNGVSLKEMRQEFSQGNVEFSSNSLDLAITGDGFFALETPDGTKVFTRNGGFMLNEQNQMVNSAGQALMSLPVDSTNKADFSEPLTALTIPRTTVSEFKATTTVELGLNLPSDSVPITASFNPSKPETYHKTTSFTVYGASGSSHLATIYYVKTGTATAENPYNKWQTYVYVDDQAVQPALIQAADKGGDEYFVNKYGEIKTRSELRELQRTSTESEKYLITTGTVYEKFSYDKLSKPVESEPASLELTINPENPYYDRLNLTNNQNGIDFSGLTRADLANMFKVSIDGSGTVQVGLEHLAGREDLMSGAELAFELTNVLNTRFGDGRSFQFTEGDAAATPPIPASNKFTLTRVDELGNDMRLTIDLIAAAEGLADQDGEIAVLSDDGEISPENMTYMLNRILQGDLTDGVTLAGSAATPPTIADFEDLLVEYDFSSQGLKFTQTSPDNVTRLFIGNGDTTAGAGEHPIFGGTPYEAEVPATGGAPAVPAEYGLQILPLDNDDSILLLRDILPNGSLLTANRDQRFGMNVIYSDSAFFIRSGSTGDTSSLKVQLNFDVVTDGSGNETKTITDASNLAQQLFGIAEAGESVESQVSQINNLPTVRGQLSTPAIVYGKQMGIDPRKSFTVNAANRNLTVIVDGISSQIQLTQGQYSIGTFTKHLQDKINLMADELGRQVSGVRVDFDEGTEALIIRGATASDESFIQIAGSSDWGLENIDAVFGKTSTYIRLAQDEEGSSPVYVSQDKDGNWIESSDKGDFDELDIPYWSPIFLDKGELTFDTSGKIVSPLSGTKMKSEGITGTTVAIDYAKSTQYNSPFAVLSQAQNGAPEGDLVGVNIGDDGLVVASYSNGTQKSLGKIIVANFKTPQGLRQIGDSNFMETAKSGVVSYGEAGSAGFGTLRAGARERSNVDLTAELVDLITAQRNFQANAKAIETSSSMTQTIINIRG
jgi:flagellar hook-basal body protein